MRLDDLVSVVVPTYNHAASLAEAIQSVQAQTYRPTEIIVVDDCSTDDTESVVAAFRDSLTYIRRAYGGIIAASRNAGVRVARGRYVAFLDADDVWDAEKLRLQIPHLADSSVAAVASDLQYIGAAGYARSHRGRSRHGYRDFGYGEIARGNPIATSSVVVRRLDLVEIGGFDEAPEFRFIEDWELWLRFAIHGRMRVLHQPLVKYRISQEPRARVPILMNRRKVLEKHRTLGYLEPDTLTDSASRIEYAIGIAAFVADPQLSRSSFREARRLASSSFRAALAAAAGGATRLPRSLRLAGLSALRWANQWLRFA